MKDSVLRTRRTGVDSVLKIHSSELFIKREDQIFFSQGTKIRKLQGIYKSLEPKLRSGEIEKVILQGNLHSNAILAGSLFFRFVEVPTKILGYSRDPRLITPASIIAKRFSELELYPTRQEWEKAVEDTTKSLSSNQFLIPEYLFTPSALEGLSSLWEEIDPTHYDRIVLDIGSGLTWISGLEWGKLPITGVCLGIQKSKFVSWMDLNLSSFRLPILDLPYENLIDPKEKIKADFSYGKKGNFWLEKSKEYQNRFGLYLEPIYAAKSISILESMMKERELEGRILYIYQGGILQGGITSILP
ncbi:1-aminocyclopropane-1-carboxylate deaminase [Leptospira hartskeerlii]|uniref:1-aminocyclopropane-1-carboxylate deaminase n=1 Tax=Leptospira hartskeerlii TaxID=2023177 RepID=A0A2M9XF20_9LEPT|nr:1-aminocyclopropane-1-carboxylate deaminase [Leptospira hartskeerlii]PJZ26277.1 1-aminocyclopropane-1-carboxylate deaminase [Leptospira hartskeerlii]PJZ34361.1 1-aminocyclopropane-1-carboxylate deaminase [Leptospira hartskeerlii]